MTWHADPLFHATDPDSFEELGGVATPAFRLSAQGSTQDAHPLDHVEAYERLFVIFEPLLRRHAQRLEMIERAGTKPRRRKSITQDDWHPFQHMKSVIDDDDRYWIGFDFMSGKTARLFDRGPTGFRFKVGESVQLDATISVSDFETHALDLDALKDALLDLPMCTAIVGWGMAMPNRFESRDQALELLLPVAIQYPALDICPSPIRSWYCDYDHDFARTWISGVNWLTLVGEPFLSALGGPSALAKRLPPDIDLRVSNHKVLFQLGDRPITGRKDEDDALLPLYHTLGTRLAPLGDGCPSRRHPRTPVFGSDNRELSLAWERRFYDGQWFEAAGGQVST